jgi:hypothetical protein
VCVGVALCITFEGSAQLLTCLVWGEVGCSNATFKETAHCLMRNLTMRCAGACAGVGCRCTPTCAPFMKRTVQAFTKGLVSAFNAAAYVYSRHPCLSRLGCCKGHARNALGQHAPVLDAHCIKLKWPQLACRMDQCHHLDAVTPLLLLLML